jgi:uncharacterized membrane protein YpjA
MIIQLCDPVLLKTSAGIDFQDFELVMFNLNGCVVTMFIIFETKNISRKICSFVIMYCDTKLHSHAIVVIQLLPSIKRVNIRFNLLAVMLVHIFHKNNLINCKLHKYLPQYRILGSYIEQCGCHVKSLHDHQIGIVSDRDSNVQVELASSSKAFIPSFIIINQSFKN